MRFLLSLVPCMVLAAELRLTHLGNAGMLVECGSRAAIVDGLFREGVRGHERIPEALREKIESAAPPFDRIEVILATHSHADHFDAAAVARHLEANPRARFAGVPEMASLLPAGRAEAITRPAARTFGPFEVTFQDLPHQRPVRTVVENTLHVIRACGQTVAFTGDAGQELSLYARAPKVDILVAPYWFVTSPQGRAVVEQVFQAKDVWAVHGNTTAEEWVPKVKQAYPQAKIGVAAQDRR
ncbi:MAG: MBL fold metallo-hydrolase [Bryobacteraceae bacterium]|nr:MBL fold metallo-hydrolase [Bryobacteraceae bacterium]